MQDWNYLHSNSFEITLELGCVKFPWTKDLKSYWNANKAAMLTLIQQVCLNFNHYQIAKDYYTHMDWQ